MPLVTRRFKTPIKDDPRKKGVSNRRGTVVFATSGPNSRTTRKWEIQELTACVFFSFLFLFFFPYRAPTKSTTLTHHLPTFACTSELFINLVENGNSLDEKGYTPVGEVVSGMKIIDKIWAIDRQRPQQHRIEQEGDEYLNLDFPQLSVVRWAVVEKQAAIPALKPTPAERGQGNADSKALVVSKKSQAEGATPNGDDAGADSSRAKTTVTVNDSLDGSADGKPVDRWQLRRQQAAEARVKAEQQKLQQQQQLLVQQQQLLQQQRRLGQTGPSADPLVYFVGGIFVSVVMFVVYTRSQGRGDPHGTGARQGAKPRRRSYRRIKERVV